MHSAIKGKLHFGNRLQLGAIPLAKKKPPIELLYRYGGFPKAQL